MSTTTIGQSVWYQTWDDKQGPLPGVVVRPGPTPLIMVFFPESPRCVQCSYWLNEDGTMDGWLEVPADGQVPADLFV